MKQWRLPGLPLARAIVFGCTALGLGPTCSQRATLTVAAASDHPDFVNLAGLAEVRVRLRYGTRDNFLGTDLYGGKVQPLLHREAAGRLREAGGFLAMERPGVRLLVWDALRPHSVQQVLWDRVAGTPREKYVANPGRGSVHSFGFAVDLTAVGRDGRPLDMGTDFDDFRPLAEPARESEHLSLGLLSTTQVENRRLIRRAMLRAGFEPLSTEWWHFDALPAWAVRERHVRVE